jgi:DNA repair exonuclease SbcCD nuclease subunit|tara:strand:- start:2670 stop:3737 length:1068 start_codon:yes stop_codon:yes gene_type:complete
LKIALVTDLHFGARNDSKRVHDYFQKFYDEIFFPTIKERGIDTVIDLGDTFDRRKYISFSSLKRAKNMFFDPLAEHNIQMHVLVGNHDAYYKNTLEINSVDLLMEEYDNITTYLRPDVIELGNCEIMMVPWICDANEEETFVMADKTSAQVLFGHLELSGYEMYKGGIIDHGISDQWLKKFDLVCSGHYHHKSVNGCINYLGTAYEITWSDYDDQKGFHIFDTETRQIEFIPNPNKLFHKIWYDDTNMDMTSLLEQTKLFDCYKGCSVKVIIKNKENTMLFDLYMEKLEAVDPMSIQVVTDHLHMDLEDDSDIIDEAEDTLTILDNYVEGLEIKSSKPELQNLLRSLHDEALSVI